jgi:hypothetical protein
VPERFRLLLDQLRTKSLEEPAPPPHRTGDEP